MTLGEIQAYLDRNMTRAARRTYGRDQKASIRGHKQTVLGPISSDGAWRSDDGTKVGVVSTVPGSDGDKTADGQEKKQLAALKQPEKTITETARKKPVVPAYDGSWEDGDGLTFDIEGKLVKINLAVQGDFVYMETTIDAAGKIKQAYANMGIAGVIIKGSLANLQVEFSGVLSVESRDVVMRKVK